MDTENTDAASASTDTHASGSPAPEVTEAPDREKIAEKVTRLVTLGGSNTNPEESRNAAKKACSLIVEYKLLIRAKETWEELGVTREEMEHAVESLRRDKAAWRSNPYDPFSTVQGRRGGFGDDDLRDFLSQSSKPKQLPGVYGISPTAAQILDVFLRVFGVIFEQRVVRGAPSFTVDDDSETTFDEALRSALRKALAKIRERENSLESDMDAAHVEFANLSSLVKELEGQNNSLRARLNKSFARTRAAKARLAASRLSKKEST